MQFVQVRAIRFNPTYILAKNTTVWSTASISQDYWGDTKEDWGLGDGSPPAASRGGAPVGSLGDEVPQKLKVFL